MKDIIAYTDGACSGNPGPGGWGFAIVDRKNDKIIHSDNERVTHTTNNKMELTAAIKALEYVLEYYGVNHHLVIHTDSTYTMNSMNQWAHGWKKNGWTKKDKKPINNPELIKRLYQLTHECDLEVTYKKVKAHQKKGTKDYDKYNDYVDRLATGDSTSGIL